MQIPLSLFGEFIRSDRACGEVTPLHVLWSQFEATATTAHAYFLRLCLDLGQVLWQEQCHNWTTQQKAWVGEKKVLGCVRWYLQGQRVGDAPVFDGLCARCGQLLYGHVNRATATTGNKHLGPPCNLNGQTCHARSQPPFLLRWPPQQLSQFVPDVFAWDEASNRLSLRDHHRSQPPWKARPHHRRVDATEQWLYCATCHPTLFEQEDKQAQCRVPFRDAADLAASAVSRRFHACWIRRKPGRAPQQTLREPIRSAEDH